MQYNKYIYQSRFRSSDVFLLCSFLSRFSSLASRFDLVWSGNRLAGKRLRGISCLARLPLFQTWVGLSTQSAQPLQYFPPVKLLHASPQIGWHTTREGSRCSLPWGVHQLTTGGDSTAHDHGGGFQAEAHRAPEPHCFALCLSDSFPSSPDFIFSLYCCGCFWSVLSLLQICSCLIFSAVVIAIFCKYLIESQVCTSFLLPCSPLWFIRSTDIRCANSIWCIYCIYIIYLISAGEWVSITYPILIFSTINLSTHFSSNTL